MIADKHICNLEDQTNSSVDEENSIIRRVIRASGPGRTAFGSGCKPRCTTIAPRRIVRRILYAEKRQVDSLIVNGSIVIEDGLIVADVVEGASSGVDVVGVI